MKKIFILLSLIVMASFATGQETEFKASNFKDQRDAFKVAESKLKMGEEKVEEAIALEMSNKDAEKIWREALDPLLEAQAFNPSYAYLNYLIARTYFGINQPSAATPFVKKALKLNPDTDPHLYFLLARDAQLRLEPDSAEAFLNTYESKAKSKDLEAMSGQIRKMKLEIKYAREFSAAPLERVWVDNVPELNSPEDDWMPVIPADGSFMLFNRRSKDGTENQVHISWRENGKWSRPEPWETRMFSGFRIAAISQDGQEVFLISEKDGQEDIYYSSLNGESWESPRKMPEFKINTEGNESHASFYFDRIKFYFVTDNDYASKGGKDIFFSGQINTSSREEWGRAHPMGSELNTPYDEGAIFMHPDGKTVYFSSKGHNAMGGYDVFRSERLPGRWAPPENLGYPVNTPYDEVFFSVSPSGKHAWFSSNRPGGLGGFDLYRITFLGPPKPNMVDYRDHLLSAMAEPVVERSLGAAKEVESVHLTILKGVVLDAFTRKPLRADIVITDNEKNEQIAVFQSNSATGKFLVSLPAGKNYGIAVSAPDYLFYSEHFNLPEESEYQMVEQEVLLTNACIGCSIVLKNIFFDTGKHTLRPESTAELNRLTELLKGIVQLKPGTRVEISGHTDNTGSEQTNQLLSENRAKSVVDFLSRQGVPAGMLTFKGYGSAQPVTSNATAAGRQQNRRTEFKIIE